METLTALFTRKSVRRFSDAPVSEDIVKTILKAGMSGPSAVNARPWQFIVVRDRKLLGRMADANGIAALPLRSAALGIMVCGDMSAVYKKGRDYWIIDAAIATQNMLLAAHDLGLGGVWLGTWPQTAKVEAQKKLFDLPESIIPHSIIALGYPKSTAVGERDLYEPDRVHYDKW